MKAKTRVKKDLSKVWVYRPIVEDDYPEFVETENYTYNRLWITLNRVIYEKYRNGIRVSFHILPEQKDIFNFNAMVEYVEAATGPPLSKPELLQ